MGKLTCMLSVSLDGFAAGPNPTLDEPLGEGGERLHEWVVGLKSWRERHGLSGGEVGPVSDAVKESIGNTGASVMGRRMFSGGEGGWEDDPKSNGWWGDDPPFHHPAFVLTHHAREPLAMQGGTTFKFVTDGIESALDQARAAAGDERDVAVAGGASIAQQYMRAGLLDEIEVQLVPILLGGGVRLFDSLDPGRIDFEPTRVIDAPRATLIRYRLGR